MKKRIICLLLAVVLFATLPAMGAQAFAAGETIEYKVGAQTMKMICEANGLDYDFCKAAIIKLNDAFTKEEDFSSMHVGDTIKLPKTNQAAADILGVALPDKLKPSSAATGATQDYVVVDHDTMIGICEKKGLDFNKCKTAIMKLNNFATDYSFLTLKTGDKLKLPKTNADAAVIAASASSGTATGSATSTGASGTATGTAVVSGNTVSYLVPHVVKAGETIYGICAENGVDFSKYFNMIMAVSGIKYATDLRVGNVVYLPSAKSASGAISVTSHTVRTGETTYGICQDLGISYSARYNMITALNPGKNLNSIRTGEVLLFPTGGGTVPSGGGVVPSGGSGVVPSSSSTGGYGGGYTPAAGKDSTTPPAVKPKEGVMYYLTEITIKKDDTVYALVKAAGFDYTTYYADVLLSINNLTSFNNLKEGDKMLMLSSSASGAKYAITGVKVKDGDTVIKMCDAAGITYSNNVNLISKLNPGVNVNSIKTGDIIVLPKKAA